MKKLLFALFAVLLTAAAPAWAKDCPLGHHWEKAADDCVPDEPGSNGVISGTVSGTDMIGSAGVPGQSANSSNTSIH